MNSCQNILNDTNKGQIAAKKAARMPDLGYLGRKMGALERKQPKTYV